MFYFFLGNTPDLSKLELKTLFSGEFTQIHKEIVAYQDEVDLSVLPKLGGTMKVATQVAQIPQKELMSQLISLIENSENKNIALTDYLGLDLGKAVFHEIKSKVQRSIRFVAMDTNPHELVMLAHQHVLELNILPVPDSIDQVTLAKTTWIYDAEDWVSRDRSKPYRDIKRGMLPPKLARIIANLATSGKSGLTLADPFCGTGTVLMEGLMLGCNVIGSDTNEEAIKGAKSNLEWILSTPNLKPMTYDLKIADATHFHEAYPSCDCIATEPYMGPLLDDRNPSSLERIKNVAKGLDKLYRGAFKSFLLSLPVGGRVVMTIPSFHVYGKVIGTISVDTLTSLGYNYISSVPYSKPGGIVVRNITILEKK